jgi:translation initiation factor IF-3
VRVVDANGEQLGILPIQEALQRAEAAGLDLVEIAATASPPVCRIMDYGKFKYEKSKKDKEAKKKQHIVHLKEIKLRPKTGEHDYQYKKDHARSFLIKGDRVKATVMFRGREITHKEFGEQVLEQLAKDLEDISAIEISQKAEGRNMISIFVPDKEKIRLYKRKIEQEEKRLAKEQAAQEQTPAPQQTQPQA